MDRVDRMIRRQGMLSWGSCWREHRHVGRDELPILALPKPTIEGVLDIAGFFDPTPICDGVNALISALRGNWSSAGYSALGMVAYVGDLAKLGKLAGQTHHAISSKVHDALEKVKTLAGCFRPRDPRLVAKAKELADHYGYQRWHRELDDEVVQWIEAHPKATPEQFMRWLRWRYSQPDLKARFPEGLSRLE